MAVRTIASVTVRDRGWAKLKARAREADGMGTKAGILGRDGGTVYPGTTVVVGDVATWNEFGTETSPKRPFLRHTFVRFAGPIDGAMDQAAKAILTGRRAVADVLGALGKRHAGFIKRTIRESRAWAVPNAPATLARKRGSTPLIDTRLMYRHINYELDRK